MQLETATIQITKEMEPYLNNDDEIDLKQRALLLYPFIQNETISYGKAAEILGISKWNLIQIFNSLNIPYLDMTEKELSEDIKIALEASI